MRTVLTRIRENRFARSVLTLAGGGLAAQAVVFLARPVLTRLYSPEAFGVLGLFVALAAVISTLATLRYEDAVVLPESESDAKRLVALTWGSALAVCGLAALALLPRQPIATIQGAPDLAPLLPLVPLVALLYAYGNGAQSWLSREHAFRLIALGIAMQSLATVGVQLAAREAGGAGLVLGSAAGAIAFALVLVVPVLSRGVLRNLDPTGLARVAQRYRRFPRLGLPASALGQIGARVPPLALGATFGTATVGYFGLAAMAVLVPLAFVADAVGHVFGVHAAEAHREHTLAELTEATYRRLLAFVAYPVLAVAFTGPALFGLVFGDEWTVAGEYARLLAPWLGLAVLVPPLTRTFDATERQDRELWGGIASAVGVLAGLLVGAATGSARNGILALGIGAAVGRAVQLGLALHVAGVSLAEAARLSVPPVLRSLLCLAPGIGLAVSGRPLGALGAAVAGGMVYWTWALRAEPTGSTGT